MAYIEIAGVIFGKRKLKMKGAFVALDRKNGLKAVVRMDSAPPKEGGWWVKSEVRRADKFKGEIYKFNHKINLAPYESGYERNERETGEDIKEIVSVVEGSWLEELKFDSEVFWRMDDGRNPLSAIPSKDCLPSDWRYREDLLYLRHGRNYKLADVWKYKLEE